MRCGDINDPVFVNYREAVSWLIGARLLEYGKNFKIGTDPGGGVGMYNLLAIRDAKTHRQRVHLNRNGSIHIFGGADTRLWWPDDPAWADEVADAIAAKCDWTERVPKPRPAIAIARLIGKALLQQGPGWVCHPASIHDVTSRTSDFTGTLFERYAGAQARLGILSQLEGNDSADRFFFLGREPSPGHRMQPWMAFDMAGYAWHVDQTKPAASPHDWPEATERLLTELPMK
jgi:hypothetical protein